MSRKKNLRTARIRGSVPELLPHKRTLVRIAKNGKLFKVKIGWVMKGLTARKKPHKKIYTLLNHKK